MRRWLISVPVAVGVAVAVLGVAGCLPSRSPAPRRTPRWHALVAPSSSPWPSSWPSSSSRPSPSPACPSGMVPVRAWLPRVADVSVRVHNGTSRTALGNQVAEELTNRGLKVVSIAGSDRPYPQTLLRYGPDGLGAAWLLRAYFWDARTEYDARQQGPSVDLILGASFVKVATEVEVNQAIAQNGMPVPPPGTCAA